MINVQETNYKTHIFGDFVTFTPIKQHFIEKCLKLEKLEKRHFVKISSFS